MHLQENDSERMERVEVNVVQQMWYTASLPWMGW